MRAKTKLCGDVADIVNDPHTGKTRQATRRSSELEDDRRSFGEGAEEDYWALVGEHKEQ